MDDPIFHTPTGPPKEDLGGEEGTPKKHKPRHKPKIPLLELLANPIDRFWSSKGEQEEEEPRRKPVFRLRLVERCNSVELCWTKAQEAGTENIRYDTVETQSPSYVYPKPNRTHSLDLFVHAKKIPHGFIDVVCRELKEAHADGKITAKIPKRKAPLPPRQLSSSPDSGREWEPFRKSNLSDSSSSSGRNTDSTTSYTSDSSSGSSNSKKSSEESSAASSRDTSLENSDKDKFRKPKKNPKPKPRQPSQESKKSKESSPE